MEPFTEDQVAEWRSEERKKVKEANQTKQGDTRRDMPCYIPEEFQDPSRRLNVAGHAMPEARCGARDGSSAPAAEALTEQLLNAVSVFADVWEQEDLDNESDRLHDLLDGVFAEAEFADLNAVLTMFCCEGVEKVRDLGEGPVFVQFVADEVAAYQGLCLDRHVKHNHASPHDDEASTTAVIDRRATVQHSEASAGLCAQLLDVVSVFAEGWCPHEHEQECVRLRCMIDEALKEPSHATVCAALTSFCQDRIEEIQEFNDDPDFVLLVQEEASKYLESCQARNDAYIASTPQEDCGPTFVSNAMGSEGQAKGPKTTCAGNPYRDGGSLDFSPSDSKKLLKEKDVEGKLLDRQHYMYQHSTVRIEAHAAYVPFVRGLPEQQVVLHLCSGRRRDGDVQYHLEMLGPSYGQDVLVLSIDVALHSVRCDLTNAGTVTFWQEQVLKKRVIGVVVGPPCESWTKVRFLERPEGDEGKGKLPPPLRTRCEPWGKDFLASRHYRQLCLATKLLFVALEFVILLVQTGGFALLEHPEIPTGIAVAPSIWYLSYLKWLGHVPSIKFHGFRQGIHGQVSSKPTRLLALRLPTLGRYLHTPQGYYDTTTVQKTPLCGRDSTGSFRTAQAKEYPPSLCLAFAKSIMDTIQEGESPAETDPPFPDGSTNARNFYQAYYEGYDPYDPHLQSLGHDYMVLNKKSTS